MIQNNLYDITYSYRYGKEKRQGHMTMWAANVEDVFAQLYGPDSLWEGRMFDIQNLNIYKLSY